MDDGSRSSTRAGSCGGQTVTDGGRPEREVRRTGQEEVPLWKFREVVESAGHAILMTDLDGRIEYVNPAFEELTGYTAEEVIGERPNVLKSGEHSEEFYADLWETISAGEVWEGELVNERKDGSKYVIDQTIAPIVRDGDREGYVAMNTDITEKRERERKIEALHDATRDLIQAESHDEVASNVGEVLDDVLGYQISVVRVEDNQQLVPYYVSDNAREYLGDRPVYESEEGPAGRAFDAGEPLVYDDIEDVDDEYDRGVIQSWLYVPMEEWGVVSVGQPSRSAFDETDVHLVQILANNAATAFKRLEQERQLRRENERLERFASTVSHDLRNPLQVAEMTLNEMREFTDQLERMTTAHERMEEVIEGVLTLARQGERVEETDRLDMERLTCEAWKYVSTDCADLVVDAGEQEQFVIEADERRLKHLLENLFRNAIEHGDATTVRVGPLDGGFYIEDDGNGIPPDERSEIFETGYTTSEEGTGLGLSIVREIAEAHGWYPTVTESPEGGARFEFTAETDKYGSRR